MTVVEDCLLIVTFLDIFFLCLPFYRMCNNTHHPKFFLPHLGSDVSPICCTSWGPDFFLSLFSFSLLFWNSSLILLTSVHLHFLLISKEISDRLCLLLPCWGHSHLFGSTHFSLRKAQESWELLASARRCHQMGFSPNVRSFWKWTTLERYSKVLNHCRILLERFLW